ncbi:hypothetical protein EBZ39_13870, partial [bacterium]|nr:hypothetical protein [bacterium]
AALTTDTKPATPAPVTTPQPAPLTDRELAQRAAARGLLARTPGINFASCDSRLGMPAGYCARVAKLESQGNPNWHNRGSQYKGLYQFSDANMRRYGLNNPFDPEQALEAYVRRGQENTTAFRRAFGRDPTPGEHYAMHQQGQAGLIAHMRNPDGSAIGNIRRFYNSDNIATRAVLGNIPSTSPYRGDTSISSGEFVNLWRNKVEVVWGGGLLDSSRSLTTSDAGSSSSGSGVNWGGRMSLGGSSLIGNNNSYNSQNAAGDNWSSWLNTLLGGGNNTNTNGAGGNEQAVAGGAVPFGTGAGVANNTAPITTATPLAPAVIKPNNRSQNAIDCSTAKYGYDIDTCNKQKKSGLAT